MALLSFAFWLVRTEEVCGGPSKHDRNRNAVLYITEIFDNHANDTRSTLIERKEAPHQLC